MYTLRYVESSDCLDTGSKPYRCTFCGRCLSRQDVLNRHLRVHSDPARSDAAEATGHTETRAQETQQTLIGPTDWPLASDHDASLAQLPDSRYLPLCESPMGDTRPIPADLAPGLLWPDSEGLLENIMSVDPSIWQQPLALAPSTLGIVDGPEEFAGNRNHQSSCGNTIADDGRHAVQSLSSLLSDTVSQVTLHLSSRLTVSVLDRHRARESDRFDIALLGWQPAYVLRKDYSHVPYLPSSNVRLPRLCPPASPKCHCTRSPIPR